MVKLNMLHRLPTFGGEASRLGENAGEATHQQLIDQLRELTYSLESNDDTIQRIIYRQLEIVVVRVGRYPGEWMLQYMQGQKTWLDTFFLEKEVGGWKSTSGRGVPLVDVGGTADRILDEFKAKTAGIEGRDQPHNTNAATENPDVETTAYDIDTPQPAKDAKFTTAEVYSMIFKMRNAAALF
ncbi:uncharacterized protein EAE97_006416 [Botrytis byssoidea]|uniref:Uncharacterized protein n=1 Tax=Botrytis byssoidea TaxID=139641 RepID=A0A9P5LU07_9HELO|nr:uncharacterized protein EAE97_006416 [Botrytis byssoidea]KAF7941579.1 hypothetical protein EAE97_006416 [Botrytis byssoidea]